jgi:uncharacterized protein (TIGR02145 family)
MKKTIYLMLFLFVFGTVILDAQVRIGGDTVPNAGAVLDLNVDDKDEPDGNFGGLLLPRLRLTDVKRPLSVNPPNGAIVWNTNDNFYLGKGLYVWGDSVWVPVQRTLNSNSTYQSVTKKPYVEIPSSSNPQLGTGMIFQVPTSYGDWSNTDRFIWDVRVNSNNGEAAEDDSEKSDIVISGTKREMVFVPYDDTKRTYSARVKPIPNNGTAWDEWSDWKVSAAGEYRGEYRLTGPTGYDIFNVDGTYIENPAYGRERTQMNLSNEYAVETVAGIAGRTPTYEWSIFHDETGDLVSLSDDKDQSTVELKFEEAILTKSDLVSNPSLADTIILQCIVTDGPVDTLRRRITVGNRDECSPAAGLLDAEGNRYTVSKFGGVCWMTENLRSTWTKQGSQVQTITANVNKDNDPYAVVYYYPGTYTADNLPPGYGFLYSWGAANIGTATTEATDAFLDTTSNRQGICPEGWTLPNNYDWNQLEREIATHPGKYSSEQTAYPWDSSYETYTGWRPGEGNSGLNWWGRTMKSNTRVKIADGLNVSTAPLGVSNENGTGFNALLVGYFVSGSSANFGTYTAFWSRSAGSATAAWYQSLYSGNSGAGRSTYGKDYLFSVRCKK